MYVKIIRDISLPYAVVLDERILSLFRNQSCAEEYRDFINEKDGLNSHIEMVSGVQ